MTARLSREAWIGIPVSALAVAAMAIDHLIGTEDEPCDDEGLADPAAFFLSVAVSLALAAFLFGVVVRRAVRDDPDRATKKAIVCALLAIPAIALLFVGLPFPLAGAAVALGRARTRRHASAPRDCGSGDWRTRARPRYRRIPRRAARLATLRRA